MTYAVSNPVSWIDQFFSDFDRSVSAGRVAPSFVPAVDVVENNDAYVLRAEIPGVAREHITVEVKDNHLVLGGKKDAVQRAETDRYRYVESRHGTFSRSFELPRNVKADAIDATYRDGVLTLRIPKVEEARPKAIEIR